MMAAIFSVYVVPSANPLMVQGDDVQALVETLVPLPIGVARIVYATMADPPVSSGEAKAIVAAPEPAAVERIRGAEGRPAVTSKDRVTGSAAA